MAPRIAATRRRRIGTIGFVAPKTPVNSVAPVASGATTVGSVLSVTTGTWSNSPTGYTYQWTRDAVNIAAATANTYTLVTADIGAMISCTVTAVNADGSNIAFSNSLGPVTAVPVAPTNSVAPVVSGSTAVGSVLSVTNGTWTGSPAPTFTYQWKQGASNISGATASTYTTVTGDIGASISCTVTATNASGSAPAASNSVGPITAIAAGAVGGAALLADETDGFAVDFTYAVDGNRVAVKVGGSLPVGGDGLFQGEPLGLAIDFTYAPDAKRVSVRS